MIPAVGRKLSGWGKYPVQECRVVRPETVSDVRAVVSSSVGPARDYISRGLGRSYGDSSLNAGGGVILHERLNRILSFDEETGIVEAEGGATFASLIDVFAPRGWFLPVTPGTRYITVGGAIAADVHGKNHHRDGSFGRFVVDFSLLIGTGEVIQCSRDRNFDVFQATLGGMGLTGAIVTARFRLQRIETAYVTADYARSTDIEHALDLFAADDRRYRYSVAWVDCLATRRSLGRSVLMRGEHASLSQLPVRLAADPLRAPRVARMRVPIDMPSFALSPLAVRAFNARLYHRKHAPSKILDLSAFFYPLDSVRDWNRLYGRQGFIQHQAVFPAETAREGLVELLQNLAKTRRASFLAVLKALGGEGEGVLSFPLPGYTIAVDVPNTGPEVVDLVRSFDRIAIKHGGRTYLAKDASLTRESFNAMYPRAGEFRAVKARVDPEQRFSSSQARRLGLVDERRAGPGPAE